MPGLLAVCVVHQLRRRTPSSGRRNSDARCRPGTSGRTCAPRGSTSTRRASARCGASASASRLPWRTARRLPQPRL